MKRTGVNICRPGFNASCSLCCGSHNFAMTKDELAQFFSRRNCGDISDSPVISKGLHNDGMQCPLICLDIQKGIIGCNVYNNPASLPPELNLFFEKTCKTFFCKSAEILSDREILFAAELAGDWYFYPLLVGEVNHLRRMMEKYSRPNEVEEDYFEAVKKELLMLLDESEPV